MSGFGKSLVDVVAIDPAANAIEIDGGTWWSWGDLNVVLTSIIAHIEDAGIPVGGRVGVFFRNRPSQLAALLGCAISERCAVSMNPMMPQDRIASDIVGLGLAVLLGDQRDLTPVIVDAARTSGTACWLLPENVGPIVPIAGAEKPADPASLRTAPGVLIEMLTSGTTGTPKRVPLRRDTFETSFSAAASAYESKRSADDKPKLRTGVRILTAPLSHISGISGALMTLAAGRKLALFDRFNVIEWADAIERHEAKMANAPPAALRMVLDANIPREKLQTIRAIRTGTAPLDPAIADEFLERYNIPVLQTYGATEFAGAVAGWAIEDFRKLFKTKRGSVGRIQHGIEARVVDAESGATVSAGDEGVLELRGAQLGHDRWVRTTDRAALDEDGFLYIHGRADNAINRGGFKIHADDVVKVLEDHPAVREASVVGIKDRRLGEVPVAALVLKAGAEVPGDAELTAFAKKHLVAYQVPARFLIVDELPRTPSMKPSHAAVKDLFDQDGAGT